MQVCVIYALLDRQQTIDVEHVEAAHAFWRYCRASAAHVWQSATGNSKVDKLLAALHRAGPDGLDGLD